MKIPLPKIKGVGALALIIINLGLIFGALLPLGLSMKHHAKNIADRRSELETTGARGASRSDSPARILAMVPALRTLVVPADTELDLIRALEDRAERTGVAVTLRLQPPAEGGSTLYDRMLGVDLKADGDPLAIGRYLQSIEELDVVLVVKTFTVNARPAAGGGAGAQATVGAAVSWPDLTAL